MGKDFTALEERVIILSQSHQRLTKELVVVKNRLEIAEIANAKLEAIKKALPDYRILGYWGVGPKAFLEKIRSIIDAP